MLVSKALDMRIATSSRIFLNLNRSAVGLFPLLRLKPCNPSNGICTGRAAVCAVRLQSGRHSARRFSFKCCVLATRTHKRCVLATRTHKRCVLATRTHSSALLDSRQPETERLYHPDVVKCVGVKEHLHAFSKLQSSRKWVASFTLRRGGFVKYLVPAM